MLNKRLQQIARPELSRHVKNKQLAAITTQQVKQQAFITPKILTILVTVMTVFILMFALSINNSPYEDRIISSDTTIESIVKATTLTNEKPKKLLDLTSIFYSEKLVSTNEEQLKLYEQLFANVPTEAFSWEGIRPSTSTDYLFELQSGQSVYIKTFINMDGGDFYVINPQTMEQYSIDYAFQLALGDAWDNVFTPEVKDSIWPLIIIIAIIAIVIYRRMTSKQEKALTENTDDMPLWLQLTMWAIFGYSITNHHYYIGSIHAGFLLLFTTLFGIVYFSIQHYFFTVGYTTAQIVGRIVLLNSCALLMCLL